MFEAIKNLSPAHRFQAFLVIIILSTVTSIATAYMNTDDCSGLAGQYNVLIKNYAETMSLNNQLVSDNNQKQKDFIAIKRMLDSLDGLEPEIVKKTTINHNRENQIVHQQHTSIAHHGNDTIMVAAMVREPDNREIVNSKTIKTETTVTKMGGKQKKILNNVYEVLKKHEKE
jgi:Tfp pilus assembly protein PilV